LSGIHPSRSRIGIEGHFTTTHLGSDPYLVAKSFCGFFIGKVEVDDIKHDSDVTSIADDNRELVAILDGDVAACALFNGFSLLACKM
jgi:hypothetical protein